MILEQFNITFVVWDVNSIFISKLADNNMCLHDTLVDFQIYAMHTYVYARMINTTKITLTSKAISFLWHQYISLLGYYFGRLMCLSFAIERSGNSIWFVYNACNQQPQQHQQQQKDEKKTMEMMCAVDKRRMHFMLTLNIRSAETVIGV